MWLEFTAAYKLSRLPCESVGARGLFWVEALITSSFSILMVSLWHWWWSCNPI